MKSPIFEIYSTDSLSGYRNLRRRMTKHWLYSTWSVFLAIVVLGFLVWLISFVIRTDAVTDFPLDLNDVLFLLFLAFMGKSMLDAYHTLIERQASVFLLAQPIPRAKVMAGKLVSISAFNLFLLAIGLGIITGLTLIHENMHFVIPPDIVCDAIILMMLASSAGLTYAVMSGLASWRRKLAGALLYSPVTAMLWLSMLQLRIAGWELTLVLLVIYVMSLAIFPITSYLILEAWNTMTSSKSTSHLLARRHRSSFLASGVGKYFSPATGAVFDKEVKTLLRRREGIGNAITLLGFLVFAVYFYDQLEGFLTLPDFAVNLLPILVVGLSLYLAVVMLCLVPALGAVSRDGKGSWVLKVAPVTEGEVIRGKSLAIALMLPFIVVFVALPVPLLAGLPPISFLYSALGALAMFAMFTGIGIWHGARYPNFDEASGNSPDVMTMYTVMLMCLILSVMVLGVPLAIAFADKVLGTLALIFAVDISFFILVIGMRGASKSLARMEVAM
jgi:hypothetical protein